MLVRVNQVLLAVSFVFLAIGLATGCLGCGPGSTDGSSVGTEANVASNNGTSGQVVGDPSLPAIPPVDPNKVDNNTPSDDPTNTQPPNNDPVVDDHPAQCVKVTPGDGHWTHEISKESLEVTCLPQDGKCAVTFDGEGASFGGTFLATELPIDETRTDDETGDVYTFQFDVVVIDDEVRAVQRLIINGVVNGEDFFRR